MRKIILVPILLVFGFKASQGQDVNQTITDPKRNIEILIDHITPQVLEKPIFSEFYSEDYKLYIPDASVLQTIKPLTEDVEIVVVLGSWCGDSREQLPRFVKILDMLHINMEKVNMIAVDSYKTARKVDVSGMHIEMVPTFIFYKEGSEIGRIVETPLETLEVDMLNILKSSTNAKQK